MATTKQTALRWNLSERRVAELCAAGCVPGAQKTGRVWAIPKDAQKPAGTRTLRRPFLSQTDRALLQRLRALPPGYWDFKNSDTRELTHGIHSYPAVMVYPISRSILSIVGSLRPVEALLDPFSGAGTVLVEGMLAGIPRIYGNDLNPLAQLIGRVRTRLIPPEKLREACIRLFKSADKAYSLHADELGAVDSYIETVLGLDLSARSGWGDEAPKHLECFLKSRQSDLRIPSFKNIGYWYRPRVILELSLLRSCIREMPDGAERDFFWAAFSETARIVSNRRSGEFKMFRIPNEKINSYRPDTLSEFKKLVSQNCTKMNEMHTACPNGPCVFIGAENAAVLDGVPDESIDLMITSPPYGDSRTTVAYGEFSRLSLQWLELKDARAEEVSALDRRLMGGQKYRGILQYDLGSPTLQEALLRIMEADSARAGDVFSFYQDLDSCIAAISSKMRPGGYQFWVVGNRTVKLQTLHTDVILAELAQKYGLARLLTIDRNIPNKTMPLRNSPTNEAGKVVPTMTNEHIVVFKKLPRNEM